MSLNLKISGSFGRNQGYVSNILINGGVNYKIPININIVYFNLNIINILTKNITIDIDFCVNNIGYRKTFFVKNSDKNSLEVICECKAKINDVIKIVGSISGISIANCEIDISSNVYLYLKTLSAQNLINIDNLYNTYSSFNKIKIINEVYNKSINNFTVKLNNYNFIINEKYILSFPSNYSNIIYGKFVKENLLNNEILNNISNKIINITLFNDIAIENINNYINNALSQLLNCGWWCKGYCDIFSFNYGQIITPYNYGSLQDGTGLFIIKLIIISLKNNFNNDLLLYFEKMAKYLINMQYSNGGIPQYYPLQGGYFNNIALNDGAYLNYLKILEYIINNNTNNLLNDDLINKLIKCQKNAFDLLKKLQIKINNIPTIWAMQYDSITLLPTNARTFEPACLGSLESCQILIYLKEINFTYNHFFDKELQDAYNYGVQWYLNNAITNIIQTITYDNAYTVIDLYVYKINVSPCRLWARMSDITTGKPFYTDRQSNKYDDINLLDNERKMGYTWLGNWGEYLLCQRNK